jgi:hypothetical protein
VETDAVEFFSLDDLPPLSLGRIMPAEIRRLDALRRGGEVDFD